LLTNGVTYVRGGLALSNQYPFAEDVFRVREGVVGRYEDHTVIVLEYARADSATVAYENARTHFRSSTRYVEFQDRDAFFECRDSRGTKIWTTLDSVWIVIVLGGSETRPELVYESLALPSGGRR